MKNVKIWNFNKTEGKIVKGEKFEEIFQKGNETNYEHVLGDFKKNLIQKDNFHLEEYVKTNCLTQKPRLYLMSKELPNVEQNNVNYPDYVSIDSDTSSLPDPADVEDVAPMTSSTAPAPTASSSAPAPTISSTATSETVLPTASTALPTASSTAPAETALSTASSNTSSPTTSLNNVDDFSLDETISGFSGSFSSPMIEIRSIVCVVCEDRPIDSSLRPCGHTICAVCAAEIQERTQMCPICRAEFNDFYPIYI